MKLMLIAGARPNFMKIAPLMRGLQGLRRSTPLLVHTGQHYDERMSDLFFRQLGHSRARHQPRRRLGQHATQTAEIMKAFEPVVLEHKPDAVLVVGDVNSTIACGLVAVKLGVR
jgi:UDP-N-acetylglucosamine 2-epimerase (non-hydrolysing)